MTYTQDFPVPHAHPSCLAPETGALPGVTDAWCMSKMQGLEHVDVQVAQHYCTAPCVFHAASAPNFFTDNNSNPLIISQDQITTVCDDGGECDSTSKKYCIPEDFNVYKCDQGTWQKQTLKKSKSCPGDTCKGDSKFCNSTTKHSDPSTLWSCNFGDKIGDNRCIGGKWDEHDDVANADDCKTKCEEQTNSDGVTTGCQFYSYNALKQKCYVRKLDSTEPPDGICNGENLYGGNQWVKQDALTKTRRSYGHCKCRSNNQVAGYDWFPDYTITQDKCIGDIHAACRWESS